MGDHGLNVKITLTGIDMEQAKIDWWVNWWSDKPERLYRALVEEARKVGLKVDDKTCLFDNDA